MCDLLPKIRTFMNEISFLFFFMLIFFETIECIPFQVHDVFKGEKRSLTVYVIYTKNMWEILSFYMQFKK